MTDDVVLTNARVVTRHETFRGTVHVVGGLVALRRRNRWPF